MRVPGGGASCLGVGRPGSGALPPPTARPLGGLPGPTTRWLWVRGGAGVGTRHQPHSPLPCVLWGRHEGARGGRLLRVCACACPAWPGRARRPPWRVLVRLTFSSAVLGSLSACSAPSGLGLPCLWLLLGFFVFFSLFLFPFSPSLRPRCLLLCVFSGLGCPGPWRLVTPAPFFLFSFLPPPPPCCLRRSLLSGCLRPLRPPSPPFFFAFAVLCCAVLVPVGCAVRVVCAASGGWCCWFLVSLPFVGGLLVALVARRCRLVVCVGSGARVWSGRRWASSLWCPVPLCCVLWAVLPWGAVLWCPVFFFFFFLPPLVALVSCCSPLVLGSGPVPGRFCFCALPVRCCAGVPASLLSDRCSLALAGLAGVVCCCLLCSCVCCWAWLSSVVSWWVLVAPGVVSRWRAVVCPWMLCCAVLLRVVPPGVALLRAVSFRFAPFGAAARCVVSWGAVRRLGVLCLTALCFVLSPRAVCVLLWCVAAWCCSPLCFVPCAPWGIVLCVSCRLRPVRCCCGPLSLGALLPCAVPRGAVLPRGAVVSCSAALLGVFLAWVWLYLLEKPLQNFVKYFFLFFSGF